MSSLSYIRSLAAFIKDHVHELAVDDDLSHFNELYGSYAISKAEDSTLTLKEAKQLQFSALTQYGYATLTAVHALNINTKSYQKSLKKLHDKLEFINILHVFREINNIEVGSSRMTVTLPWLLKIHKKLTRDLDDIFADKLIGYDNYNSGILRKKDNIVIGQHYPIPVKEMEHTLHILLEKANTVTRLEDLFALHAELYYLHPFTNGNKRICRILEIVLLRKLGIDTAIIPPSLGYYRQQARYIKWLIESALVRKDFSRFIPFGYSSLYLGVLYLLHREMKRKKHRVLASFDGLVVLSKLDEVGEIRTSTLRKHKSLKKLPERTFYVYLKKEVELLGNLINIRKVGRNTLYSLNISDPDYATVKAKFLEILNLYQKENPGYHQVSFLKGY